MIKDQLGDLYHSALKGEEVLTKFLDIDEQKIISSLPKKDIMLFYFGGYSNSERVRCKIVANRYINSDLDYNDKSFYNIVILRSKYDKTYNNINHRHVLGTIMSLGIKRNTFGDICIDETNEFIYIFTIKEISDYIINNLSYILKQKMEWEIVDEYNESFNNIKEVSLIISSNRLDSIVSKAFCLSREDGQELVKKGMVMINHHEITNVSKEVKENDIISVRKHGRINVNTFNGYTQKGKISLSVSIKK